MRGRPSGKAVGILVLALASICGLIAPPVMAQGGAQPVSVPPPGGSRSRVDIREMPWRAIGKLQATAGSLRTTCTGVLVAPLTVLSAAHCLVNIRTGRYFLPSSLHFLVGFEGQGYFAAATIARMETGPGFDVANRSTAQGSDWALLTLAAPIDAPDRILPIDPRLPKPGTAVMVGGYAQDNPNVLTADLDCRILGTVIDRHGRRLLRHDCQATHGVSGAPMLVKGQGGWRICGINVARSKAQPVGYAAPVLEARKHL